MENVTRDVIVDLWALYSSGEASQDTRKLVEAFLRDNPEFAQELRQVTNGPLDGHDVPSLPPDHELKTLARIKRRLSGPIWLLRFALVFTCLAFGRIVSDTSFDVSPRNFIATAAVAVCFWAGFLIRLFRGRREVLFRLRR